MKRENIKDISEDGPILPFIKALSVSSFNYAKEIVSLASEERFDETLGFIPAVPETYVSYPEGTQVMIEPNSLELLYPESVVTLEDGSKYYRADFITALLVQAIKEIHDEFSNRITKLEKK